MIYREINQQIPVVYNNLIYEWRIEKRFIQPITKNILHYIFKGTEGIGKIISIYYLQFKAAELFW